MWGSPPLREEPPMKRKTASKRNSTPAELREVIPPIPDTPENIGRALLRAPPKKHWRCLEKKQQSAS